MSKLQDSLQKTDSAINIFVNVWTFIKENWITIKIALLGSGSMTTLAIFDHLPLTAIVLAGMFGAIGLITLKEKFTNRKEDAVNEKEKYSSLDSFTKELLLNLKNNSDVEKIANGSFIHSHMTFKYNEPIRKKSISGENWVFNQDLTILIPQATKKVRLGFEVILDKQKQPIKGFDIFVKVDGKFDKLDSVVKEIDFDVSKTSQLEFYFSGIDGSVYNYTSHLLIKSITL